MSATSVIVEDCLGFCILPNHNAPTNLCMQSYDVCQHLQENLAQNRIKSLDGKATESAIVIEDGGLISKVSFTTSDSTSGVFSSLSSSADGSKHESSNTKLCPSPDEGDTFIGNDRGNHRMALQSPNYAMEGVQHSSNSAALIDPCYVADSAEDCYEVTIQHTVVNRKVAHLLAEENADQNSNSFSSREVCFKDHLETEQRQIYSLTEADEDVESNESFEGLFYEREVPIAENFIVSDGDYYVLEEELPNARMHEYFEIQRRNLLGQYEFDLNEMQCAQQEIRKIIDEKIENCTQKTTESYKDAAVEPIEELTKDSTPICPVLLESDEELDFEEKEYIETRDLSSYDKYTSGPFNSRPMPMDDILEERAHFQPPRVCWVCTGFASADYGDNITAVVPFANEMTEEDREVYPKKKLTLKEKIKHQFRKLKKFIKRKSRRVELLPVEKHFQGNDDGQELFLLQIEGSWNICYEAEANEDETNMKVGAIIGLGQYCPPNSDDVRKVIAKNPNLYTIIEDDEDRNGK